MYMYVYPLYIYICICKYIKLNGFVWISDMNVSFQRLHPKIRAKYSKSCLLFS